MVPRGSAPWVAPTGSTGTVPMWRKLRLLLGGPEVLRAWAQGRRCGSMLVFENDAIDVA